MRLICPNCDAEYQVDDAAIPEAGRDVQCSNCGHAWFQLPAEVELANEAEDDLFGAPDDQGIITPPPAPILEQPAVPITSVPVAPPATLSGPEFAPPDAAADAGEPDLQTRPAAVRQTLAESVLSVLREEAERETAVRRDEVPEPRALPSAGVVQTQTEFGLDAAVQTAVSNAAARHLAKLKGAEPDLPLQTETRAAARRDLLPDIEEINSTLRANTDRVQADMDDIDALPDLRPRRRGFRSGFVLMMIVAVLLAMTYIIAPRIMAQMPGTAPALRAYVATVDQGRLWLDGKMKSAGGSVRSLGSDGN